MSDARSSRPRLVSLSNDGAETAAPLPAADPPRADAGETPRRLLWLLAVLVVAALAGLVAQTQRTRTLQAENAALAGELFTTRSALDAYVSRFAEVRLSLDGLRTQVDQLDTLVSADLPAPPAPEAAVEAADALGD